MKKKQLWWGIEGAVILLCIAFFATGCVASESVTLEESPLIYAENPQDENMADLLQRTSAGAMVQIHAGDVLGSGVIWRQEQDRLVIATAGHVLTAANGEVQVKFFDGWTAPVSDAWSTDTDLAFFSVALKELPEGYAEQYYLVNVNEESAEQLQSGEGVILMGSATGVAADAWEGVVLEPWIYVEDFGQSMILVQAQVKPGMSGGALFDDSGHFLGILCGGNGEETAVLPLSIVRDRYESISENF